MNERPNIPETAEIVVSDSTLFGFCITGLVYFIVPVLAFFIMKKYGAAGIIPVIAGVITYFLSTRISDTIVWAMSLPAAVMPVAAAEMAGISEETGRYLAMKYPVSGVDSYSSAVCCGIGHAGLECWIRSFDSFSHINRGQKINMIGFSAYTEGKSEITVQMLRKLADNSFFISLLDSVEVVINFGVHIALSLLIFKKLHEGDFKFRWLLLAVFLHLELNELTWTASLSENLLIQVLTGIICGIAVILIVNKIINIKDIINEIRSYG